MPKISCLNHEQVERPLTPMHNLLSEKIARDKYFMRMVKYQATVNLLLNDICKECEKFSRFSIGARRIERQIEAFRKEYPK